MKAPQKPSKELPVMHFKDQEAWETWLSRHHGASDGVRLRLAKKSASLPSLSYPQAVEVALCFGWIDGKGQSLDEHSWLVRFSPRRPRSIWSRINRSKAEKLIEAGRMHEPGRAAIAQAKQNGQWDKAYDSPKTAAPPEDFEQALRKSPKARAFFETLDGRNRYAVLFRLHNAKKEQTRRARIEKFIAMLERHETIYPPAGGAGGERRRDTRFVAEHRGGPLGKEHHYQLMEWACECAKNVLHLAGKKTDARLSDALEVARRWRKGAATVGEARKASVNAIAAAREASDPTAEAVARSVGHAVATAHMADHCLGAALYALKAVESAGGSVEAEKKRQDRKLPAEIRELVLSAPQRRRI